MLSSFYNYQTDVTTTARVVEIGVFNTVSIRVAFTSALCSRWWRTTATDPERVQRRSQLAATQMVRTCGGSLPM